MRSLSRMARAAMGVTDRNMAGMLLPKCTSILRICERVSTSLAVSRPEGRPSGLSTGTCATKKKEEKMRRPSSGIDPERKERECARGS